jgi:Chaperone of endosialidase/Collagen triple helix repeat (20 copies)
MMINKKMSVALAFGVFNLTSVLVIVGVLVYSFYSVKTVKTDVSNLSTDTQTKFKQVGESAQKMKEDIDTTHTKQIATMKENIDATHLQDRTAQLTKEIGATKQVIDSQAKTMQDANKTNFARIDENVNKLTASTNNNFVTLNNQFATLNQQVKTNQTTLDTKINAVDAKSTKNYTDINRAFDTYKVDFAKANTESETKLKNDLIALQTTSINNLNKEMQTKISTGSLKVNRSATDKYPQGWGAGVHSWDVYANGTIGTGKDGNVLASMNSSGGIQGESLVVKQNAHINNDLILDGSNKWIMHTPNDGRKAFYVAPAIADGTNWDWNNSARFDADGTFVAKKVSGTNMNVSSTVGKTNDPLLSVNNKGAKIDIHPLTNAGAYNSLVGAEDQSIIFHKGQPKTGNLVIGAWDGQGMKISSTGEHQIVGNTKITGDVNITGKLSGTQVDKQLGGDYEVFSEAHKPSNKSEGWSLGDSSAWDPKFRGGRVGTAFITEENETTATSRWIEYNVPTGMRQGYLVHLPWHNGRYFDVFGVTASGNEVFLRRVNAYSHRTGDAEGLHGGTTSTSLAGVNRFAKIKIKGVKGRIHLMGIGWTKEEGRAMDSGFIHYDNVIHGDIMKVPGTIQSSGRLQVNGGEKLYLLNKDGVTIGKEWGGNGNLSVQGDADFGGVLKAKNVEISGTLSGDAIAKLASNGVAGPMGLTGATGATGLGIKSITLLGTTMTIRMTDDKTVYTLNVPLGPTGATGPKGDTGATGASGATGATGPIGPMGPKGDTGLTGAMGPKGDTGLTGAMGPKGDTGLTGAMGPKGDMGPVGATGATGATGVGISNITAVGNVVTVTLSNGSTKTFTIPTSTTSGTTSGTTSSTTTALGIKNITLSGTTMTILMTDDKTTYTVNVPVGPPGPKGDTGATGAIGPVGPIGPMGPKGATGATGATGPKGDTGISGAIGPKGDIGLTGPAGPKGDTGATGATGAVGSAGPKGADGVGISNITAVGNVVTVSLSNGTTKTFTIPTSSSSTSTTPSATALGIKNITASGNTMTILMTDDVTKYTVNIPSGPPGPTGPKGDVGATGAAGPAGIAGAIGPTGARGADGVGVSNITASGNVVSVTLSSGVVRTFTIPTIAGPAGAQGVSISKITTSGNVMTITMSNGTAVNVNIPSGPVGATGVGIADVVLLSGNKLQVKLDSGVLKEFVIPTITGPTGATGVGISGVTQTGNTMNIATTNGKVYPVTLPAGASGVGISNVSISGTNMIFTMTDGTTKTVPLPSTSVGGNVPLKFNNDGTGIVWGNNFSKIYDNAHLNIETDDNMYLKAPNYMQLDTKDLVVNAPSTRINDIKFTKGWSGYPDGAADKAEISNDTGGFKTLMIVGNKAAGKERRVDVWDTLTVNGTLRTTANAHIGNEVLTNKLRLGSKFQLSGVGDGIGNDEWLRLMEPDTAKYAGGFAANKMWTATGTFAGSDARLKKNIKDVEKSKLDKLNQLKPKEYDWKENGKHEYGFIAQDVEKLYPDMVTVGPNNMKSLNYNSFIPILTGNIQEIKKSIPNNKELCIEDVCLTKEDLLKLKKN